jgi:hypothetical protein
MQHSGAADGHVSPAVSKDPRASKHKRSSVDAVDQTAGAGAKRSPDSRDRCRRQAVRPDADHHGWCDLLFSARECLDDAARGPALRGKASLAAVRRGTQVIEAGLNTGLARRRYQGAPGAVQDRGGAYAKPRRLRRRAAPHARSAPTMRTIEMSPIRSRAERGREDGSDRAGRRLRTLTIWARAGARRPGRFRGSAKRFHANAQVRRRACRLSGATSQFF